MTGWASPVARLGGELAALRNGLDDVASASGLLRPDRLWEEIARGLGRAQAALDSAEQLYRSYWLGDDEEEVAGVDRREVLCLWGVLLGAAAVPPPAIHRLVVSLDQPAAMDESLLTSLGAVTQMYAFSYPHVDAAELLPPVRAHLDVLAGWLPEPMTPRLRARLGSLVAETAAMAGWAALTLNLRADAWSSFTFGRDAARDAGDGVLHAQVLGSLASLHSGISRGRPIGSRVAVRTLEEAAARARHAPALTRAWVAARLSEERAAVGDAAGAREDFRTAEDAYSASDAEDRPSGFFSPDGFLSVWGEACLSGYQGISHVLLGQGDPAVPVLVSTLDHTPDVRQQVVVLADLAAAWTLAGEPEEACRVATRALDLAGSAGYPLGVERIRGVRRRLDGLDDLPAVRELDERLAAATPRRGVPAP